ncbi:SAM-dependent methyltransferases [Vibrio sp. JCM 19236]|nr:SAM-dependent methyltransferases [Vibrio sp. JCM 19236]
MERLGLVQQLFQRPLELWLVLDKALYLQEQGYQVELSQFCDKK